MHEDEEIRYVLGGSGFFNLRKHGENEEWIGVHVIPGDLLVVPAGIYHRFTQDEGNRIKAMRLFEVRVRPFSLHLRLSNSDSFSDHSCFSRHIQHTLDSSSSRSCHCNRHRVLTLTRL